ncbi:hypothetical protein PVK06_041327 [Gossypium arboreum]|uniref:Uncharacterized protein n=1 Tax=Gossypium arboreum TaxID=29729 RepID=A0ABR0NA49_GOSAR|nr:hypothetical protein PVK06_041327 [Gossypium arboreum]
MVHQKRPSFANESYAREDLEWLYGEADPGDVEAARGDLTWEINPLVPFQCILEASGALSLLNFGFLLGSKFGPSEVGKLGLKNVPGLV